MEPRVVVPTGLAPDNDSVWPETGTNDTFQTDIFHPNHLFSSLITRISCSGEPNGTDFPASS